MIEIACDLWSVKADWICVPTNGTIKNDGTAVMGRGVALEAKNRFPGIENSLAFGIQKFGNIVQQIYSVPKGKDEYNNWIVDYYILAFPTKHHWRDKSDINLIERSCQQLVALYVKSFHPRIVLPRPGCGNGGLSWDDVRPICEFYFRYDDFIVVHK